MGVASKHFNYGFCSFGGALPLPHGPEVSGLLPSDVHAEQLPHCLDNVCLLKIYGGELGEKLQFAAIFFFCQVHVGHPGIQPF